MERKRKQIGKFYVPFHIKIISKATHSPDIISYMKIVMINSKSSEEDFYKFNPESLENLKSKYRLSMYNTVLDDFSNIPELFENEEKIVIFNHFALENGFEKFSQNLPRFKGIRYLLSTYSSYSGLDLELLKKQGIKYRNNGGANAISVAQYAITTMFMLLSRFPQLSKLTDMPDGSVLGEEYRGKTAGIIGMGNVGESLLETLSDLGIKTVYYNRTSKNLNSTQVDFEEVFKQDIIFITIATNKETSNTLKKIPEIIKNNNYLIDVSGHDELYDKQKMIDMLAEDKFKGYGLETDLRSDKNLNLITTPHIAWCTYDAEKRTIDNLINRVISILEGKVNSIDFIV